LHLTNLLAIENNEITEEIKLKLGNIAEDIKKLWDFWYITQRKEAKINIVTCLDFKWNSLPEHVAIVLIEKHKSLQNKG